MFTSCAVYTGMNNRRNLEDAVLFSQCQLQNGLVSQSERSFISVQKYTIILFKQEHFSCIKTNV